MELFLRAVCPGVLRELAPICCTDTSEELKVPESAIMAYPVAGKAEQDNPSALSALNRGTLATTMIADGRSACEMASASVGSERRASGRAATDKRQASAEVAADGSQACPASQAVAVGEESDAAAPGDASGGSPACADADAPPRAKEPLPKRTPPPLLRLPTPSRAAPRRSVEDPVAFPAAKAAAALKKNYMVACKSHSRKSSSTTQGIEEATEGKWPKLLRPPSSAALDREEPSSPVRFSLLLRATLAREGQHVYIWRGGKRVLVNASCVRNYSRDEADEEVGTRDGKTAAERDAAREQRGGLQSGETVLCDGPVTFGCSLSLM